MNTQKQIFLIVVLFFATVVGCAAYTAIDMTVRAPDKRDYYSEESITRGALLFANNCRTCHGARGEGGAGPQLNKDAFKSQDPLVLKSNRDLLRRTISCGRAGTLMPTWLNTNGGSLNAVQIEHIVDLLTHKVDPGLLDEDGNATNKGWLEAFEYSANLNHEASAIVSGDTLDSIANAHGIGAKELAALNNLAPGAKVAKGQALKVPPSKQFPNGWTFKVDKKDQTVAKVADALHVGAVIVADLNDLSTRLDVKKGTLTVRSNDGQTVTGLLPGEKLKLPDGATYRVVEGDTVQSIADRHGLTVSRLQASDSRLALLKADGNVDPRASVELPAGAVAVVQAGQTFAMIAQQHGLTPEALATSAGLAANAALQPGQRVSLPFTSRYVIQEGDTVETIARLHGLTASVIANSNPGIVTTGALSQSVLLVLPKIDAYTVKGQSLEDMSKSFGNVTAASLGGANSVPGDAVLRVGTTLKLPADAWGSAPPDTKNPGTGCTQYTVSKSAFDFALGLTKPEPARPATLSSQVTIEAHANDWTVIADGQASKPNEGAVTVNAGGSVTFRSVEGLHTISPNKKKDNGDLKQGDSRTVTFSEPNSKYVITCDYHPEMFAWVYTQ